MSELITVNSFSNVNLAQIAMLQLRVNGIDAVMIDAETIVMDWFLGRALGLIKVQVRSEDEVRALEILNDTDSKSA